jgi:hypothetical protein
MDRREQFINPVSRDELALRARGRQWFADTAQNNARDQAELERWYQDYHHWHHADTRDRARQGFSWNMAEPWFNRLYFRWFRWMLGLPVKAPPSRYDRFQFSPNKGAKPEG